MEEVARSAHVRRKLIESVDERVRSGWKEFRHMLLEGEGIGRESYLHHLRHVILALGHHGNVIILGRGAAYILPPDCAVRVRLVAPLELRARRVAERENIPLSKAERRVEQTDAERAAFIREAFGKDVNAAEDYDLVLNTGDLSARSCRRDRIGEVARDVARAIGNDAMREVIHRSSRLISTFRNSTGWLSACRAM